MTEGSLKPGFDGFEGKNCGGVEEITALLTIIKIKVQ
jgi:hypothetical protein